MIAVPLAFGASASASSSTAPSPASTSLAVTLAAASLRRRHGARHAHLRARTSAMLRASRGEALTDALTGLGNRRALTRALDELLPAGHGRTPARARALRPRRLQAVQRHLRPPGGRHAARAPGRQPGRLPARPRPRLPDGRRRVLRASSAPPASRTRRPCAAPPPRCPSRATASRSPARTAPSCCPSRPTSRSRRCGSPTSACTRNKHAGRTSAGRQSKDVLLRALAERDPGLGTHAETVTLAVATAEALGMSSDEVEQVRHASELHDVGKVAIPDAILGKPGPLTEEEWALRPPPPDHRRAHHPRGARARARGRARALQPRALGRRRLPRRAGRRRDRARRADRRGGRRLRGDDRRPPYRAARTPEQALAELRAGAGTQFDPAVVDAWCAAHARRGMPAAA